MARRIRVALLLAGLAAVTAFASPAVAGDTVRVPSTITIHEVSAGIKYRGRVFSQYAGCVRNRAISMWHVVPGPDDRIATFNADADGRWVHEFVGDRYYVVAARRVIHKPRHTYVCKSDRSPTT